MGRVKVEFDDLKGVVQKVGSGVVFKDQMNWNKQAYHSSLVTRSHTSNHTLTAANSGELHIVNASLTMTLPAAFLKEWLDLIFPKGKVLFADFLLGKRKQRRKDQ